MTKRKYLTQSEVQDIFVASRQGPNPERDHCLVFMSFIHGLRVSEALNIRLSDIDLKGGSIFIRRLKNGFSTSHPLLKQEIIAIRVWLKVRKGVINVQNDWLFTSGLGEPLSRQRVYAIISQLGVTASILAVSHPHMLRHVCGFALAERGIDTRLIQDYLGHRNIRHTVRYTASNTQRFHGVWTPPKRRKMLHLGPKRQQLSFKVQVMPNFLYLHNEIKYFFM